MKRSVLAVLLAVLAGCIPPAPPAPGPDVPPPTDAGPPEPDAAPPVAITCQDGWNRLQALSCAVTTPRTGSWIDACANAQAHAINMNLACVILAADCAEARRCLGE